MRVRSYRFKQFICAWALGTVGWGWGISSALAVNTPRPGTEDSNDPVVQARSAWAKKDSVALMTLRDQLLQQRHPLAQWVDYWELNARLQQARPEEITAFYRRWPDTYVEDRLRNDWLLEAGRRGDMESLTRDITAFRMQDDPEVACWSLLIKNINGTPVTTAQARDAFLSPKDSTTGCETMAVAFLDAKKLTAQDVWRRAREATEANRQKSVTRAVGLVAPSATSAVAEIFRSPAQYLSRKGSVATPLQKELTVLALIRLGDADLSNAADLMQSRWAKLLPDDDAAWIWASLGKDAAQNLLPEADDYFQTAELASDSKTPGMRWSDETLAWKVRAALRANEGKGRWQQVMQGINAMTPDAQKDPAWMYWKAQALRQLAKSSEQGSTLLEESNQLLRSVASPLHFYGQLALEQLGQKVSIPARPTALTPAEKRMAVSHPGLQRALALINLGLRSEGVREWNYVVGWGKAGGWSDRELRAIAQLACDQEIWDRCINTSDKTKTEIDIDQRYPLPYRAELSRATKTSGAELPLIYGLIRQESRFISYAKSHVGASGLMQVMPATARWTAKKLGIPYDGQIHDVQTNLALGTGYYRLLIDDLSGSQVLATAGYNAGPGRPRRWRNGPVMHPAAWTENIPFTETRDYVKKVLSNATIYTALMTGQSQTLSSRLGRSIGPRPVDAPSEDRNLP